MNEDEWLFLSPKRKLIVLELVQKYFRQREELTKRGASIEFLKLSGYDESGRIFVYLDNNGVHLARIGK